MHYARRMQNRSARRVPAASGMNRIEITILLAVVALVVGVLVGPRLLLGRFDAHGRSDSARAMTKQIEAAYARWRVTSTSECPASLDDLKVDLGRHRSDPIRDAWGHDYVLRCGDDLPAGCKGPMCVYSLGRDGKENTQDDIRSWEDQPR
jgi:hypothetical protein